MRYFVTGEWTRNRLMQVIVVLYSFYVALLWVSNALLYFSKMSLAPASVVAYYLGDEEKFLSARSYQGLLEVSHFHLFAIGMLLLVLTHLMLFVPLSGRWKAWLISLPFLAGLVDEGAGWLVRFAHRRQGGFLVGAQAEGFISRLRGGFSMLAEAGFALGAFFFKGRFLLVGQGFLQLGGDGPQVARLRFFIARNSKEAVDFLRLFG